MKKEKIKYPASYLVHWVTGAVACCENHANQLVHLGKFTGAHVPVSLNSDNSLECENCINESKSKK